MSRHRQQVVRPRYGRIAALGAALAVTAIAVLGGTGVLPTASSPPASAQAPLTIHEPAASLASVTRPLAGNTVTDPPRTPGATAEGPTVDTALPAGSGTGYRVVFSQSRQRVWLVPRGHRVDRTYLVSGSLYDNLDPGTYEVYSRSEQAWGVDDSGTMKYFVRFAHGDNAAIGFHDIPINDGKLVQSVAQLGTPMSHGCIRQERPDAIALWKFAPLGTKVVVTK